MPLNSNFSYPNRALHFSLPRVSFHKHNWVRSRVTFQTRVGNTTRLPLWELSLTLNHANTGATRKWKDSVTLGPSRKGLTRDKEKEAWGVCSLNSQLLEPLAHPQAGEGGALRWFLSSRYFSLMDFQQKRGRDGCPAKSWGKQVLLWLGHQVLGGLLGSL